MVKDKMFEFFFYILRVDSYLDEDIFGENDGSDYADIYDVGKWIV